MERKTFTLSASQARRLERLSRRTGDPISSIVRQALEAHLDSLAPPTLPSFVGIMNSGRGDLSERVEEIIGEMMDSGEIP